METPELLAAARRQDDLWRRREAGEHIPVVRSASLREGYAFQSAPEHGLGLYSVHIATGEVCECKMVWCLDGTVLICPVCFLDGT